MVLFILMNKTGVDDLKNKDGNLHAARRGVAAVLSAGCIWGTTGIFTRLLGGYGYDPMTVTFARLSLSFIILFCLIFAMGRRDLLRIRLKDLWIFIGTGASSAILLNYFFNTSVLLNSLALATVLLATMPIFVVLLSAPFFNEHVTSVKVQALIVVFAGCVLASGFVGSDSVFSPIGILVGIISAMGYALYSVMSRFALNRGYGSFTINLYSLGIGALVCLPFANFSAISASIQIAPATLLVILLFNALCSLLPYMLYTYGMNFMETGKASILVSVEPVAAAIFGITIYGEIPTLICVVGIVLVLAGIVLLNLPGGLRSFFRIGRR